MGLANRFAAMLVGATVLVMACAPALPLSHETHAASSYQTYLPFLQSNNSFWPLTTNPLPGSEGQPNISPDGKTVVFLQTTPSGQTDIYAAPFNQGVPVNLTQSPDVLEDTPRFTPDGSEIIFARRAPNETWDIYTMNLTGTNLTKVVSDTNSTRFNEVHPFVTQRRDANHPNLRVLYSSDETGNWELNEFGPVAYPRLTNSDSTNRFPSLSPDGTTILFRNERAGNSDLYTMDYVFPRTTISPTLHIFAPHPAFDGYPNFIPDSSGVVFDSDRTGVLHSHVTNPSGLSPLDLAGANAEVMRDSAISADARWQVYAGGPSPTNTRLYVRAFESPLFQIGMRGQALLAKGMCSWDAQTLAMSWAMTYAMTGDTRYIDWTRAFVDACAPVRNAQAGFEINDGLIGYASLMVYRHTQQTAYLDYARSIADWMLSSAQRTADGTLVHEQKSDLVWCDTLLGVTPLLTELTRVTSESRYLDEAVQQVILHAKHLQDPATGLYHHAWQESQNTFFGPVYWARGNGWIAFGNALVSAATIGSPAQPVINEIVSKHIKGLALTMDASGRWHTVLNNPNTYVETSGSGLISFALGALLHCGSTPDLSRTQLREANLAVWQQVAADGTVREVQGPTGPINTDDAYNALPYSAPQLYGQAIGMLNSLRTNDHLCGS